MRYSIMGATVEQIKKAGGTDIKEARTTGIIFATLPESQVARLKAMGCQVAPVSKVGLAISPPVAPPAPVAGVPTYTPAQLVQLTGLEDLRGLSKPRLYGQGLNLAIVDTGIRATHSWIGGHVVHSKNYTSDPAGDGFNHGTGVASIALAVAPECNLLDLKVLNNKGEGTEEEVVLAIDDVIAMHDEGSEYTPSVINLSLGSPDDGNPNNILRVACRAALERNIWVIAAAGNSGPAPETIMTPACERYVAAVGSARYLPDQKSYVVSDFSSRGPTLGGITKPDLLFFGEDLEMASSVSDTATISKSGTSFAAPFTSGVGILFLDGLGRRAQPTQEIPGAYPELGIYYFTLADMLDRFLPGAAAKPRGMPAGKDNDYGCGIPVGSLILEELGVKAAVDLSTVFTGMIAVMMLGMVVKMV